VTNSLKDVLEIAKSGIPAAIIGQEGYAPLSIVAEKLPFELSSFWGFESRLGEAEAVVDILFEIKRQSRGRFILAGRYPSELDTLCREQDSWRRLREFAIHWADSGHDFAKSIRNIWLEFDTASAGGLREAAHILQQPCIFLGPDTVSLQKSRAAEVIGEALEVLQQQGSQRWDIKRFIYHMPEEAQVFQVGLMLSRANTGLRICVFRLKNEDVIPWLAEMGWPGDTAALSELLQRLPEGLDAFAVDVNLLPDGRLAEKIGIECYMDWLVDDPRQWEPMIRLMEKENLCIPAKSTGLIDFQGSTVVPEEWNRPSEGKMYTRLYRRIHHIKLSVESERFTEAKAYLAINHPGINYGGFHKKNAGGAWLVE
jgi:hypothetical protein